MEATSTEAAPLPLDVGIRFAHATVQAIADQDGIAVLHMKGPVVDATLRAAALDASVEDPSATARPRHSVDADVLVHPRQARQLVTAMERHGWELAWDFDEGSLFAHAATMTHPHLMHVDIHRWFPGIESDPAVAFSILASKARRIPIADFPCLVPADDTHRLILLLHAARSRTGSGRADIEQYWARATPEQQAAVRRLAAQLEASVALAAAIDELDSMRHHRSYRLWHALQQPQHTHRETLMGHLRAAPPREFFPLVKRFLLLNKRRMERQSGGPVRMRETVSGYRAWVVRRIRGGRR